MRIYHILSRSISSVSGHINFVRVFHPVLELRACVPVKLEKQPNKQLSLQSRNVLTVPDYDPDMYTVSAAFLRHTNTPRLCNSVSVVGGGVIL